MTMQSSMRVPSPCVSREMIEIKRNFDMDWIANPVPTVRVPACVAGIICVQQKHCSIRWQTRSSRNHELTVPVTAHEIEIFPEEARR